MYNVLMFYNNKFNKRDDVYTFVLLSRMKRTFSLINIYTTILSYFPSWVIINEQVARILVTLAITLQEIRSRTNQHIAEEFEALTFGLH